MRVFVALLTLVVTTSVVSITRTDPLHVQAAAPTTLNFQARLLSSTGSLVPDGTYNIEFKLYNASTSTGSSQGSCTGDANCLWTETRIGGDKLTVKNGYISAYLGDISSLPTNIWNQQLWLTMNIGGSGSPSWDGEMTPRIRLTSVPYAFRATVAESAETLSKNTGSFTGTVDFSTLTANRTFLFPDTSLATTGSPGTICVYNGTASNCPAASGSAYYIQNDTVLQTAANFNMQARDSTTNGTVAGVFRGAAGGQTVDLLQFQATNGTVLGAVTAGGNLEVASFVDTRVAGVLTLGGTNATGITAADTVTFSGLATDLTTGANEDLTIDANGTGLLNLNDSVVVAANQTLRLAGGTTVTRNAIVSPAEGTMFFDTDTDRLLIYANGKWQADRSDAIIVAASNSSQADKDAADYVAGATNAENAINLALTAATGGTVFLMPGTYTVGSSIQVPNNTTLSGAGDGTLVRFDDIDTTDVLIETNGGTPTGQVIRNMHIDGQKSLNTGTQSGVHLYFGSKARVENVKATNFNGPGISLDNMYESILINNRSTSNNVGFSVVTSGLNVITGNYADSNTTAGLLAQGPTAQYNTISNNIFSSNVDGIKLDNADNNTITGNQLTLNTGNGIHISNGSDNNLVSSNAVRSNATKGINLDTSVYNNVSSNTVANNGGATTNEGIYLVSADSNSIKDNHITDTSATTNNYPINISNAGSDYNYISGNDLDGFTLRDLGTNTIYAGQTSGANLYFKPLGTIELQTNTNVTGTLAASTSVLTPSLDTASAGTLSIGNTNATTIDIATNAASHTLNIATGAAAQTVSIATGAAAQTVSIGSTNSTSSLGLQGGSGSITLTSGDDVRVRANDLFVVQNQAGSTTYLTVNAGTGAITLDAATALQANGSATFDKGITLGSTAGLVYTTPLGFSLSTRINIPNYNVANFDSIISFGLPAASSANARAILIADARTVAHQPTIAVLSPDESTVFGLSWEGSNSTAYLKTLTGAVGIRTGTTDIATFATTGINLLQNTTQTGSLTVNTSTITDDQVIMSITTGGAARFNGTITAADLTAARTWTLPDESGTICTNATGGTCAGLYIQNQNASQQATSNFWISGTARADTSVLAPLFDNTTAATLNIGTVTATGISLSKTGATTAVNGTLTVAELATFNGGITAASNFTVTPAGNVAFQRNTTDITATGTLNDLNIGTGALFRFSGASAQTVTSIANPADGRVITLINAAATSLTIQNDAGGTAANRIITGTGGDVSILTGASMTLAYDSSASRWRIIGAVAGGGANQQLSNLSGTVAVNLALNPGTDNTLDLGSSANSWRTLYADTSVLTPTIDTATATTLNIGTVTANAVSISRTGVTTTVNGALTVTQATTINGGISVASNLTVTQAGNVAFQRNTTDITATGTLTDLAIGTGALFRFSGASAQTLSSIASPADGRIVTIINAAATALVIQNDTGGTAANRIVTGTGANISVPAGASITLAYDSSAARWRVIGAVAPTNGYIQLQSATPGTAQTGHFNISGTGIAATSLLTPILDAAAAGSLSLGTTTATSILMGSNTTTTISVGQSTATNTVNIGNGNLTSGTQTINIGTGPSSTGLSTISIGSTNAGSGTTIRGGTAGINLTTNGGVGGTTGTIVRSLTNDSTGAFQVQNAAGTNVLNVDTTGNNITLLGNNSGEPQSWASGTALTTGAQARDNTGAAVYNGYLYIPAGDNGTTIQTTVAYIKIKADGSLDTTWATTGSSVPSRTYTSVIQANGYLYILGGSSSVASSDVRTEVYVAKINTDGTVGAFAATAPLTAARKAGGVVVMNGYMYYVGGDSSSTATQARTNTVYYTKINPDGTLATWSTATTLPNTSVSKATIGANGLIYYFGGSGLYNEVYSARPSSSTGNITAWTSEGNLPGGRSQGMPYVMNGYVYYAGGELTGTPQTSVYYAPLNANGSVGSWSTAAAANALPLLRTTSAFTQANGYLYAIGGWNGSAAQATAYYASTPRVRLGASLDLVGLSGEFLTDGRAGGELTAGNTRVVGTLDVQDMANFLNSVTIQRELSVNGWSMFRNTTNSATAYQFQNAAGTSILNIDTTNGRIGINTAAPSADLTFGEGATRTINVLGRTTNAAGSSLTVSAGAAGAGASPFTGGTLTLQGGAAGGTGNANGGGVTITGGAGTGTGVQGLVRVDPAAFYASTTVTLSATGNLNTLLTNATNIYSTVPVNATGTGYTLTVDLPTVTTVGRILYISAVGGSSDFTLLLAGTSVSISMKANSTATLIYNGTGWTAAGASSSTDLQAAYNNTLSSAGGAEVVLNASGGAADGLTIRNNATTPISGGILEVQSSIGTNLFSVNNYGTELAANGGAETLATFTTNWTAAPAGGTVTRTTTAGQFVTGLAGTQVATTTTNHGVRNNLAGNPVVSTTYTVSFTVKASVAIATNNLNVQYSRDGGTDLEPCTSYSSQNVSTTVWTKITCTITTDGTTATNPDLIIRQGDATARNIWIDNLSFIQNDSSTQPSNVQIGGGINGGPVTLFTLDRASAPPVANGNTTYYGSMYYDTTTGRIQCYESDGWGACGSAPDNIITLTPEYAGAVLNGSGVGTMTADFCANQATILVVGTLCASGEARNFYRWTSPQASLQNYSIYVTYKLPTTFKEFSDNNTMKLTAYRDDTDDADALVTMATYRKSSAGGVTQCGTTTDITNSLNTWEQTSVSGSENSCGFVGGDYIVFQITASARSNKNVYIENLDFTFLNQ